MWGDPFNDFRRDHDDEVSAGGTLSRMVWNRPKVHSYYLNGKRRNTMSSPWRLVDYWWMMRQPKVGDLIIAT